MIKLTYVKTNINANKLHEELGDLGIKYFVKSDDTQFYLLFPDLIEQESDVLDVDGNLTDTVITYKKKIVSAVTENDEEGNETTKEVVTYEDFDMDTLKASIQSIIDAHDPTPNLEKIYQDKVKILIREQYTIEDEIGLTNDCNLAMMAGEEIPTSYIEYRTFVETCKDAAYLEVYGSERT